MPTCPTCGTDVSEETVYCPSCGTEFEVGPPSDGRHSDRATGRMERPSGSRSRGTDAPGRGSRGVPQRGDPPPEQEGSESPPHRDESAQRPPENQAPTGSPERQSPADLGDGQPSSRQRGSRSRPPVEQGQPAPNPRDGREPPGKSSLGEKPATEPRSRDAKDDGTSRRGFILGGLGLAALGVGGWYAFQNLGGKPGPADVAESFIDAVDDANWTAANDLVHSDSLLGDAANVIDLLGNASTTGQIANLAIDELDLQTTDSTVREESGEQAIVDLTVELDIPLSGTAAADLQFDMQTESGDWRVYDVGLR